MRAALCMVLLLSQSFTTSSVASSRPIPPNLQRCFEVAAQKYQISSVLLRAIAQRESSMNPRATNHNRNKAGKILSTDYGLMQINSIHLAELKKLGVITSEKDLLHKPCLNIQTGAWILARHFKHCGLTWDCIGSYNAGFSQKNSGARAHYSKLIKEILMKREYE